MRRAASLIALFIALSVLSLAFLFFSMSGADSRTIVVGGSASMSAHVRLIDTFTFNGLDSTRFGGQPKVTYNAPGFASDSVSGFSQTISGFGIAVSPTPTVASGPLTDNFGNLYYHYEWSLSGYTQDSFTFVVTTDFDSVTTGSPTPESFSDPYPVPATGQGRFLASTSMAQAGDPRIVGQAQPLVAGAATEAAAVESIMGFVKEHVSDNPNEHDDAVSTLLAGTGDCVNRANLALALLRASGIPARIVNGIISDRAYRVDFAVDGVPAWMEGGWYNDEAHAWIEVYYPQKNAWVAYDPYRDFGFVDSRHVKSGIAADSDVTGKTTGGLGNLAEISDVNFGVTWHHSLDPVFSSPVDSGSYTFRFLKETPGGESTYILGRDMVNAPTPTPSPTPVPTVPPTPTPVPLVTPTPAPNATITPAPAAGGNATATPAPSPVVPGTDPGTNVTGGSGTGHYNISGSVIDGSSMATLNGATLTFDGQPIQTDARGAFTITATNGTHLLTVDAPGYGNASLTLTVAGADVIRDVRLSRAAVAGQTQPSGMTPGFGLITTLAGLLIIALYRYGRA